MSEITIGVTVEIVQQYKHWLIKQGAPEDKAEQYANYLLEFFGSQDAQKFWFRGSE